jgi:hypothetical protein
MKMDEAELLSEQITDAELIKQLIELGWTDQNIKKAIKGKDDDN